MQTLQYASLPSTGTTEPLSKEALSAILAHYGFDYFIKRTLRKIDLNNPHYSDEVDDLVENFRGDEELGFFSIRRVFNTLLEEVMQENDCDKEEALEILAEDDYVIDVNTAMTYSVEAGDTEIDALSEVIRNRATRMLRQLRKE